MKYPSTLRYLESLSNPKHLFGTLKDISLVCDNRGNPILSSGNFGTVFKIKRTDGFMALKCFTRDEPQRSEAYAIISDELKAQTPYIVDFKYLCDEITVFEDNNISTLPVLLMDWVDGLTLTAYLRRAVINRHQQILQNISADFDRMALWLLQRPFAHGDLKPDNIMVRSNGNLTLIDYDGIFTPKMTGTQQREIGTPEFQHPLRANTNFDKTIDHYSIALISITLKALALLNEQINQQFILNGFLFIPHNILNKTDWCYNLLSNTELSSSELFRSLTSESAVIANIRELISPLCCEKSFPKSVEELEVYQENNLYGYINSTGQIVIEPQFESASCFNENMASVKIKNRWGYINTRGSMVIPAIYDYAAPFTNGAAVVSLGGKFGYIKSSGVHITKMKYDNAWSFREHRGLVRKGDKYGFVDLSGKQVIRTQYDFAHSFNEGLACVMQNNLYGYIYPDGRWAINPQYDFAQSFRKGQAQVESKGKMKLIEAPNK